MVSLIHVRIENFKSIQSCSIAIKPGFTIISGLYISCRFHTYLLIYLFYNIGANGSGKSVFLESIAFALGANPNQLRVSVLKDLLRESCSNSSSNNKNDLRLLVELTFKLNKNEDNKNNKVVIGCSILDNQRYYNINLSKVSKEYFLQYIKEKLKFSQQGWNIAQKAVQSIIRSNPHHLFDMISYVSGTNLIFEAKNQALGQIEKANKNLTTMKTSIDRLQQDISDDQLFVDQINQLQKVSVIAIVTVTLFILFVLEERFIHS